MDCRFLSTHSVYVFVLAMAVLLISASSASEVLPGSSVAMWGIPSSKVVIPVGSIITEAVLTIHGVSPSNTGIEVYLLGNPKPGFQNKQKNKDGSLFAIYGTRLTGTMQDGSYVCQLSQTNDPASHVWSAFPYPFDFPLADNTVVSYSSALLELIDYAGTDVSFGFGIESSIDSDLEFLHLEFTLTIASYMDVALTKIPIRRKFYVTFKYPEILQDRGTLKTIR